MRMLRSLKQRSERIDFRFSDFSEKQLKVLLWWCKASPVRDRLSIIADGYSLLIAIACGLMAMFIVCIAILLKAGGSG